MDVDADCDFFNRDSMAMISNPDAASTPNSQLNVTMMSNYCRCCDVLAVQSTNDGFFDTSVPGLKIGDSSVMSTK